MLNLCLASLLIIAAAGMAIPLRGEATMSLEQRLWVAAAPDLPALEADIVREIQQDPQSVYHHYLLTNVYLRRFMLRPAQGKLLEQAMQLARQTVALDTNAELGYLALADIYEVVGKHHAAREVLRVFTYRANIKRSWRYFLAKAKIQLSGHTLDDSLGLLHKALQQEDVLPAVVIPYVIVLLDAQHAGDRNALSTALTRWRTQFPHYLFDRYLAALHLDADNYQIAWQLYGSLLAQDPHNRELRRNRAIIAYLYMGKEDEAQQEFLDLLVEAKDSTPFELALINMHLGVIYLRSDKEAQAQEAFLTAIAKHTEDGTLLELIVETYRQEEKFEQLAHFLQQLNIAQPGNAVYYGLLGDVLTEYLGDYRQGAAAYENAIVLDPLNSKLYLALGMARYRLQEFEQALQMFGKARSLDTLDATAFYNEACMYALLSRDVEAIYALQKAIELDATLRAHAREDADFDKIRTLPAFVDMVN